MAFVENFGANTVSLYGELELIQREYEESHVHYIEGRIPLALETARKSNERLEEIREDALKEKDRALLWIYVIEWLSISATLMITGYVLDLLMIRKRLYRRPSTTRLEGR